MTISTGTRAKLDYLLSENRDFEPPASGTRFRYAILSTPRSGSSLLSDTLYSSKLAGDPLEYLNKRFMKAFLRNKGINPFQLSVRDYLNAVARFRTSPNGYFGVKIHFDQVASTLASDKQALIKMLKSFDSLIFIQRRNKLKQAISLYRALSTQIWSSRDYEFMANDDPRLKIRVNFSAKKIASALYSIAAAEESWLSLLDSQNIAYRRVYYEDLVCNSTSVWEGIFDYLNLSEMHQKTQTTLKRQSTDDDPFIKRFISSVGLNVQPG